MTELDEASAEWHMLTKTLDYQIAYGDSAPVELWALRALKVLLNVHEPCAGLFGAHPACSWCIDTRHERQQRWPCETYRLIEQESRRDE